MQDKIKLPEGNLVIGRNSVKEVLRNDPGRIIKIFTSDKQSYTRLFSAAELQVLDKNRIPVQNIKLDDLTKIAKSDSHQSLLAVTKRKPEIGIKDFLKNEAEGNSLVLMLDDVQDPHNFGAILRAAECFGVKLVIYSKNKGVGLTSSVSKASVGASELLDIISVSNLADSLRKFKDAGYWAILADADADATSLKTFEFPQKTLLILGSEGRGAQALIKKEADFKVFIDLYGKISSLNVSQAAAIMLDSYRRQYAK
jgi:23S rRNA (guanosine2251-2'-O)-methyltransferase